MFHINPNAIEPVYEQIKNQVIEYIIAGVLKPNDALPSVRNVAKDLGIKPNTVSKAYTELDMMNIIYSIAGKGMFVSDNTTYNEMYLKKIKKEFSELGRKLKSFGYTNEELIEILGGKTNDWNT